MTRPVLFVDFDKTLFDSEAFLVWLDRFIAKEYGSQPGEILGSKKEFYVPADSEVLLYDAKKHFEFISGERWDNLKNRIEDEIKTSGIHFYFDDALTFLKEATKSEYDMMILTFGDDDYQRFKINFCTEILNLNLPLFITQVEKRRFIQQHFNDRMGILIDDRHPQDLPEGWIHIWLDRSDEGGRVGFTSSGEEERAVSLSEINLSKIFSF